MNEYKGVYVFAQQVDGVIAPVAFELLGKGRELAAVRESDVTAVLLGYQLGELSAQLIAAGADRVLVIDKPELETYMNEPYTWALTKLIEIGRADV